MKSQLLNFSEFFYFLDFFEFSDLDFPELFEEFEELETAMASSTSFMHRAGGGQRMNTTEAKRQIMLKQWAALIKEQQSSGLNKKTWCLEHGIKSGTFYYWQNLVRQAYLGQAKQSDTSESESSSSELVKVDISKAPVEAPTLPSCNSLAVNNKETVQPQASHIETHPNCIHLQYKGSSLDIPAGTKAEDLSEILKALAML